MTLRIGILGAARVAPYAMIAPAREIAGVEVAGIAARDPARAAAFAQTHGVPTVFEDYSTLISSPAIDAVYIALPPGLHADWSVAALDAGKPVLVEKPFALGLADVDRMLAAETRSGSVLMEAQHSHYHPLSARAREIVAQGLLGTVRGASAHFTTKIARAADDIRRLPDVGGGALWDLGVYPAYWLRSMLGEEFEVVSAGQRLAETGADSATWAELVTPAGATATLNCDLEAAFTADIRIEGEAGTLEVRNPLVPQEGHYLRLTVEGQTADERFTLRSTYEFQLEAFRDAVDGHGEAATRGTDSRATIELLDAIRNAASKERQMTC